jgi:hypothetical protein
MLKAFLDASGTTAEEDVIAVAGWAASEHEWDWWEQEWKKLLTELDIKKRWHHTDFLNRKNEYARWNDAKHLLARGEVCRIMNKIRPFGIGASLWRSDYDELWKMGKWNIPCDPYDFCIDHCLEGLIQRFHEVPKDEGIAIFVDQDNVHERTAQHITHWHEQYVRQNETARNQNREIKIRFGSNMQYVPLQAADILANETFRYMHRKVPNPYLGAIVIGMPDADPSPVIQELKKGSYLQVELYSKQMLEWVLEGRASGEHRMHGGYGRFLEAPNLD